MSLWLRSMPIAHRGAHWFDGIDENSWESFEKAVELDYAFEIDVHLSLDEEVYIHHDQNLKRMCDRDVLGTDLTSGALKNIKSKNSEHGIVLLRDLLSWLKGRVPLVVEIKHTRKDYLLEDKVAKLVKDYKGEVAIQSFHPLGMLHISKKNLKCLLGMLGCSLNTQKNMSYYEKLLVRSLCLSSKIKPDYIAYLWSELSDRAPQKVSKKQNIPLLAWTVRNEWQRSHALKWADNIIFENLDL